MRALTSRLLLAAAFLLLVAPASAQKVGVMVRVSTLGLGGDLTYAVTPKLNLRASANFFGTSPTQRIGQFVPDMAALAETGLLGADEHGVDGLTMQVEDDRFQLGSAGVLVDWHPTGGRFHLTAGGLYNFSTAGGSIRAAQPYYDASLDYTFSAERVGSLNADISYKNPIAPYVGFGLGRANSSRFGLNAQFGAAYTGPVSITMEGEGLIGPTAENAPRLESGFDSFRWHPVVSLGFTLGLGAR